MKNLFDAIQMHGKGIYNGMRSRKLLAIIADFVMHQSFMFTVAMMGLVHATLLVITLCAGVVPIALFNAFSVTVYLVCVILCKSGHIKPVYFSILFEVCAYATVSIYYMGWVSGAYYFLFSIVPIMIYFGSYIFKGVKRYFIILTLILIFALFILLYVLCSDMPPVYNVSKVFRGILVIFSAFAMLFAVVFYSAVYIIASERQMYTLEKRNEQLSSDVKEDSLTSLLNRRGFVPLVEELINDKSAKNFCVAFFDIDDFKNINDTYGHECGDEILSNVSKLIKKEMRNCDICRWGGEEFVILMKDTPFSNARNDMEYMRRLVESTPVFFYNKLISVTITIGLVECHHDYQHAEDIIKAADERMYYGKQHGKNILIYEDL